ncbi:MAG: 1-acyl-sn-glycerol-3-phosphate acyltransferase, partial [Myxococcota bacterium]
MSEITASTTLPEPRREIATVERFRSGMLRRFGPLYHLSGLGLALHRIRLEAGSAENIRAAATRGPVVYVLHTRSKVDWLALNRALNRRRLPLAVVSTGVRGVWFRPFGEALRGAWRGLKRRVLLNEPPDPIGSGAFQGAILRREPVAAFLLEPSLQGPQPTPGLTEALLQTQAQCDLPIQLVPVVVHWRRGPGAVRGEVGRVLLGSEDEPGPLYKLFSVYTRRDEVMLQAGEAVDLQRLRDRYSDESDERVGRRLNILLRRYLYRESRVIRGPRVRPHRWTRRLVLHSPAVRTLITEEARTTQRTTERLELEVRRTYDRIAARFSFPIVRLVRWLLRAVWDRVYSGIDVREVDLARIRSAMRAGTPILTPCHRSHLDYMLVSTVCYDHNIVIPHIVASEKFAAFPLGGLNRRLGALFIKKSFDGDRIYSVVFRRYLHQLIRDGFPVEFFLEGGRSRTGKLLPPRLGVLSMVLDSAARGRDDREVTLLPVAISYEQIAEEKTYAKELGGARKRPPIRRGMLVRISRFLRQRMGRVYLRVGEPLPLSEVFDELKTPWEALSREQRQEVLQQTGERMMFRIARNMVILPTGLTAMALLARSRRGIRVRALQERAERFDNLLRARGAAPAASMGYGHGGWVVEEALARFQESGLIDRLEDESGDIIQILEAKRVTLDYYKNGLLHFVAPVSLLAAAVRTADGAFQADDSEIFRLFRAQVFLLRYEFTLDPEQPLESLEADCLQALIDYGALAPGSEDGSLLATPLIDELEGLTSSFRESYRLVLQASYAMRARDLNLKNLSRRILEYGRGRLAVDELTRPEALTMANLDNAVRAFREEGVLQVRAGGSGLQFDEAGVKQYLVDLD